MNILQGNCQHYNCMFYWSNKLLTKNVELIEKWVCHRTFVFQNIAFTDFDSLSWECTSCSVCFLMQIWFCICTINLHKSIQRKLWSRTRPNILKSSFWRGLFDTFVILWENWYWIDCTKNTYYEVFFFLLSSRGYVLMSYISENSFQRTSLCISL